MISVGYFELFFVQDEVRVRLESLDEPSEVGEVIVLQREHPGLLMVRNGVTLLDRLQRFDLFAIDGLHLEGSLCNSAHFCT